MSPRISKAAIVRLHQGGMSPATIAQLFDLDLDKVRDIISSASPDDWRDPDVTDLQSAMRRVSLRVVEETMMMLDEGSPAIKQRLLTNLFAKLLPLMTTDAKDENVELKEEMASLIASLKDSGTPLPDEADHLASLADSDAEVDTDPNT